MPVTAGVQVISRVSAASVMFNGTALSVNAAVVFSVEVIVRRLISGRAAKRDDVNPSVSRIAKRNPDGRLMNRLKFIADPHSQDILRQARNHEFVF